MSPNHEDLEFYYERFSADHDRLKRELMTSLEDAPVPSRSSTSELITVSELDEELGKFYERFDQEHTRLESELVSILPDVYPQEEPKAAAKWAPIPSFSPIFRAAVYLLVIITAAFFLSVWTTRPAYALQDVFDRMLQAHRIHLRGMQRPIVAKEEVPVEIFLQRPDKFWASYFYKRGSTTAIGQIAGDGQVRNLALDSDAASSGAWQDLSCWATLEMETMIAETIGEDFLTGSAKQFNYVGTEKFNGLRCDIYERKSSPQRFSRLYVDHETANPVRVVTYLIDADGNETKIRDLDHIVIEPNEIPEHISFTAPPDLSVEPLQSPVTRFKSLDQRRKIHQPVVLDIGPGAILACWSSTYPDPEATFSLALPDGTSIASDVVQLPQTNDGTTTWNWVIVKPADSSPSDSGYSLHSQFTVSENGFDATFSYYRLPIRLGEQQIQEVLNSFSDSDLSAETLRIGDDNHAAALPSL